jgi:hypothetical protein
MLVLHDNARFHISHQTTQTLVYLEFSVQPHPPYSPDLAPSDYSLFDKMKDPSCSSQFSNDDNFESSVCESVCTTTTTGLLPGRYQIDGNGALTSVGSMWSVLKWDYASVIISQPIFQESTNHL